MSTEFMGYARIEQFGSPIMVRGHLLAKPVMATTEGGSSKMQGRDFTLELLPDKDGWQVRLLTVHGVRMEGDKPTTVPVLRHFFMSEPENPLWVRALVAQCTPPQAPPRPARTQFGLDTDRKPKLCGYCADPIVAERRRNGQWYVHVKNGTHRCPDGSGNDCNTLTHARKES